MNSFVTLESQDDAVRGSYSIIYNVYYADYEMNYAVSPVPFTITIVGRCNQPESLSTAFPIRDREYTITDRPFTYQAPSFSVEPASCDIVYSLEVSDKSARLAFKFDANPSKRIFTFHNEHDLQITGSHSKQYTVTIIARTGTLEVLEESTSFHLTLRNPCIDPEFVTIEKSALPAGLEYTLYDFESEAGYKFTHEPFTIVTKPIEHNLCGELYYRV